MSVAALLVAAGIAAALAARWLLALLRARAWRELGASLGLAHSVGEPGLGPFGSFRACRFGEGHLRLRALRGRVGEGEAALAVLQHTEDVLGERRTWQHTACLLESPQLSLAPFSLRPQRVLDRLGKLLGGRDIGFPDDPEFSQAYVLQGPDEAAVRALFDARSRRWFAQRAQRRLVAEGSGRALLLVAPRALAAHDARALLDTALELARLWSASPGQVRDAAP